MSALRASAKARVVSLNFPLTTLPTSVVIRALILINIVKQEPAVIFSSSVASDLSAFSAFSTEASNKALFSSDSVSFISSTSSETSVLSSTTGLPQQQTCSGLFPLQFLRACNITESKFSSEFSAG